VQQRIMPTYLICNNLHRIHGIVLNLDCYLTFVSAKSRQQALKDYTENYSAIPLSQFTPRERQQIYRALGEVVPQCCGRAAALDSLNYWRCRSCKTYYPRNPGRPKGGAGRGQGRKFDPVLNRPSCCGRPMNKHSKGSWRCPICKHVQGPLHPEATSEQGDPKNGI
jgi:hypothetical protein